MKLKRTISAIIAVSTAFSLGLTAQARFVGDVNKDNSVNSSDALEVLSYSVGKIDKIDETRADVNEDKLINSSDALLILQISVGTYKGALEINDDIANTLKAQNVDPVIKSGKFTIETSVESDGSSIPTTIMVDGNNMSTDLTVDTEIPLVGKIPVRLLVLDGKCYLLVPSIKLYTESSTVPEISFTSSSKETFVKSENVKIGLKTYVCETYSYDDGTTRKYYFYNNEWKISETISEEKTTKQTINSFKTGVDKSHFSLDGYTKGNLGNIL